MITTYASNMRSEWCGCMKSSSMACPNKTGTKEDFATYKKKHTVSQNNIPLSILGTQTRMNNQDYKSAHPA